MYIMCYIFDIYSYFCDCIVGTFKEFGIESREGGVTPITDFIALHHTQL